MSTRPIRMVLLLVVATMLSACGGSTTAGIEARAEARKRLDLINAELTYDEANRAFEVGQFEKATRRIDAAIAANPESARYHLLKGRIYFETHRLEEAIGSFAAAMEHDPDFADAHYFSGIVYQRWSDDAKAYEHYLAAYELEPSSVGYLLAAAESMVALGQLDQAKQLVDSKLAYFEHNAALHQLLGQIALLQGDPATAAKLYGDAWLLNPEDQSLLEELAHARYAAGMYGKSYDAVKQLQRGSDGDRPDLKHLEARCLAALQRLVEARNLYLELTRLRPTDTGMWIGLGAVAWELGDFQRVAQCGARVAALAPDRYEGYLFKGINEQNRGNLAEAASLLRQATVRAGDIALPHLVLGRTLEQAGDRQGALDAYGQAVRGEPDNVDARALLSQLSQDQELTTVQHPQEVRTE